MKRYFVIRPSDFLIFKWRMGLNRIHNWARERCFQECYDYYILNVSELEYTNKIRKIFEKIDADVIKFKGIEYYSCKLPLWKNIVWTYETVENKFIKQGNYESLEYGTEETCDIIPTYPCRIFFVTICDKESIHKTELLKKTLRGNLIVIDTYDKSIGNFSKLFKFREFLHYRHDINEDDVICFIDAFDVICIRFDENEILHTFKSYNKNIIIGCEENCGPEHTTKAVAYFIKTGNYLNGGFQIGYKKSFIDLQDYIHNNFEELKNNLEINRNTEQGIISQVFIKNIFDIGLDVNKSLVNNWGPRQELRFLNTFFIHVIRADTFAPKFILTDDMKEYLKQYYNGIIKYDKHIDMILNHKVFSEQTIRLKEIINHFFDFDVLSHSTKI